MNLNEIKPKTDAGRDILELMQAFERAKTIARRIYPEATEQSIEQIAGHVLRDRLGLRS